MFYCIHIVPRLPLFFDIIVILYDSYCLTKEKITGRYDFLMKTRHENMAQFLCLWFQNNRHLVFALRFLTMTYNNNFGLKIKQHPLHSNCPMYSAQTKVVCMSVCLVKVSDKG